MESRLGPRVFDVLLRVHGTSRLLQTPHGCALSHLNFRLRHWSQASPGCCRGRDLVDSSDVEWHSTMICVVVCRNRSRHSVVGSPVDKRLQSIDTLQHVEKPRSIVATHCKENSSYSYRVEVTGDKGAQWAVRPRAVRSRNFNRLIASLYRVVIAGLEQVALGVWRE